MWTQLMERLPQNRLIASLMHRQSKYSRMGISNAPIIGAISFVIAVIAIIYIVPLAITQSANTTAITGYSSWGATLQGIWGIVPYVVIFGAIAMLVVAAFQHYGSQ